MPELSIQSNGRLAKTAVYYNGEQLAGIREFYLNLEEDGTFEAVLQYIGSDKEFHTKQIFSEHLDNIRVTDPSFTEDEAEQLQAITIDSDGDIDDTGLWMGDEELEGVISLFVHIKTPEDKKSGLGNIFGSKKDSGTEICRAEITFRNEDDSTETEIIF
jgi:hypothetical protein